jgi:hypothetical protein
MSAMSRETLNLIWIMFFVWIQQTEVFLHENDVRLEGYFFNPLSFFSENVQALRYILTEIFHS